MSSIGVHKLYLIYPDFVYLIIFHSVYFVEEVNELFEINLIIWFYPSNFNHCVHFFVCYALA